MLTIVNVIRYLVCAKHWHDDLCRRCITISSLHSASLKIMESHSQRVGIQSQLCVASTPTLVSTVLYVFSLQRREASVGMCQGGIWQYKKHPHLSPIPWEKSAQGMGDQDVLQASGAPAVCVWGSGKQRVGGCGQRMAVLLSQYHLMSCWEPCPGAPSPGTAYMCQQTEGFSLGPA